MEEGLSLRKKIYPGTLDVHPTENAIVVNYTVQASIVGDNGQPVAGDKKDAQKIIRIKILAPTTNIGALAEEVVEKCKLIHSSRVGEVEQLLYYLQQRQSVTEGRNNGSRASLRPKVEEYKPDEMDGEEVIPNTDEPSSIDEVESYIEGLYEELAEKIKATRRILQLAKNPDNMIALAQNESLMSALSRVLREEGKRSMELVTNIIYIFFCFSNFSEFHPIITANKIGDMCLKLTDQELTRFNLLVTDLQKAEAKSASTPSDRSVQAQLQKQRKQFHSTLMKQDQLFFVTFHLLLNVAEDLSIEVKMVKRDIIKYLFTLLDRKSPELLILSITFLKKLSVFRENKDELLKNGTGLVQKLSRLLDSNIQPLQGLVLRLLLNLSHDTDFRTLMNKENIQLKLISLLSQKNYVPVSLQLLYQLTLDDKPRQSNVYLECIPQVMKLLLESKGDKMGMEIMALAINLSTVPKFVQAIMEDNGFKFIVKKALKTKDSLLFKFLRNISQSNDQAIKLKFLDYIDDIMKLLVGSLNNPDLLVETLGILGNLTIPEFDFAKLASTYNLLSILSSIFKNAIASAKNPYPDEGTPPGLTQDDDVLMESVILLGTMGLDEGFAQLVMGTPLLKLLIDIMVVKEEDDELILQVAYCVHQYLLYPTTKKFLIGQTRNVVSK